MDNYNDITITNGHPRPEDPLDVALREHFGLVQPEWAPTESVADESLCKPDDGYHWGPGCRCN